MNPVDILAPAPRRARRTTIAARLRAWLTTPPAPRRAADHVRAVALREAIR